MGQIGGRVASHRYGREQYPSAWVGMAVATAGLVPPNERPPGLPRLPPRRGSVSPPRSRPIYRGDPLRHGAAAGRPQPRCDRCGRFYPLKEVFRVLLVAAERHTSLCERCHRVWQRTRNIDKFS